MNTKIKNTLFRFATLRKPELIEDEIKNKFFIFHPDFQNSSLFATTIPDFKEKINPFPDDAIAYRTGQDLKLEQADLYNFSNSILKNRLEITADKIVSLRNIPIGVQLEDRLQPLSIEQEMAVWDNLIYQISTKKDIKTRDIAMTLLYGNYLLKTIFNENIPSTNPPSYSIKSDLVLNRYLQARIVIPSPKLFKKSTAVGGARIAQNNTLVNVKTALLLNKSIKIVEEKLLFEQLQQLSIELLKYRKNYNKAEAIRKKQYEVNYANLIDTFYIDNPGSFDDEIDETPQTSLSPREPVYSYEPLPQIDIDKLEEDLTAQSFHLFNEIEANDANSFKEVKEIIQKSFSKIANNQLQEKRLTKSFQTFKGIILPSSAARINENITFVLASNYRQHTNILLLNAALHFGVEMIAITQISVTLFQNGLLAAETNSCSFTENIDGVIGVGLFPNGVNLQNTNNLSLEVLFTLNTGSRYSIAIENILINSETKGLMSLEYDGEVPVEDENEPIKYGITRLGIADYKTVEQSLCCYQPGEVSHIENIMASEYKEKSTKRVRKSESTTTYESTTEREQISDTVSTERNDLHQEISKIKQESKNFAVQLGIHWGKKDKWGGDLNTSFAYSNNKEEAHNMAKSEAKELTERAMDRIVNKVREERINKITEEYTEEQKHGLDNRLGIQHISGVYRWLDKKYENQIFNYGKRLIYEFMIPEPAYLHNLSLSEMKNENIEELVKPLDPRENGLSTIDDVNISTYQKWASMYNASIEAPPRNFIHFGKSYAYMAAADENISLAKEWNDL